jgi:predicted component of type VI protein secretion system
VASFNFVEVRPMEGAARELEENVTIGREGCDVVVHDPEVSRRHAALRMTPEGPAVEDLGSSNGTYVNGDRIDGVHVLHDGDVVRFGKTEWHLQSVGEGGGDPPQVTEVRAVPTQAPAGGAPATQAPATDAPLGKPATEPGRRGDVPPPPPVTPSAVHRVLPPESAAAPPPFAPVGAMKARGSAATRSGYTIFCLALVAVTLVALILYFLAA